MFKRILFPTDGSEQANRALEYVIDLAGKYASKVIVLHTYDVPLLDYIPGNFDKGEIDQELLKECNRITLPVIEKLKEAGIKEASFIKEGHAGFNIVTTAQNENCDAIIMGSRGSGTVKSVLIGSVSNYVVHHATCVVLLVY
jgi:nucleotide-binding universal stress UspA family protein